MRIMVMMVVVVVVNGILGCSIKEKAVVKEKIKVAFYVDAINTYDPAKIMYADQYTLLENIYSRLVMIDEDASLGLDLASEHYWDNNSLVFLIKDDAFTTRGRKITAEDVVKSYKRLMLKNTSSHFNLKKFLGVKDFNSINDKIAQLYSDGNKVVFKLNERNDLLLRALTSADFAVIPSEAFDQKTLEIIDYSNTTGDYSVSENKVAEKIILLKNKFNKKRYINEVILIHNRELDGKRTSVDMLIEGKIDYIPTVDITNDEETEKLTKVSSVHAFHTLPFDLRYMIFTKKGLKRFTKEERTCIAFQLKDKLRDLLKNSKNIEDADQIFPKNSEGYLFLTKKMNNCNSPVDLNSLRVAALPGIIDANQKVLNTLGLECNSWKDFNFDNNEYGENDLFFSTMDSAYHEDVSLVSMYGKMSLFGPEKSSVALTEYTSLLLKEERLRYIKDLNNKVIEEQYVIPLFFSTYRAFYNSSFRIPHSKLHLGIYFSKIESLK